MFIYIIILPLAITSIFSSLAFAAKHRHLDRRSHARAPLKQVWSLSISVMVTNSSLSPVLSHRADNTLCISPTPVNTVTDRLNRALQSSGTGFILSLCPSAQYMIQAPIVFTAPNQEISTLGYPTGDSRATLVVSGPVPNGQGHTTAVDGTCGNCTRVKLRNIQAGISVYSVVDSLFTSSKGQWKSCRRCSNLGWSKYRDGRPKLESADRIRAFL
jgi:hypothetical protein